MDQANKEYRWMTALLSGHISREEELLLNTWLNQSSQNRALFEEVRKIWESSGNPLELSDPSTETEWKRLEKRLQQQHKKSLFLQPRVWMGIAACLILTLSYFYFFDSKPSSTPYATEITPTDSVTSPPIAESFTTLKSGSKVLTLELPDHSQVWLNQNSILSYGKGFLNDRQLILHGEAYFIVKHSAKLPFRVNTLQTQVTVLGTSFNIKEQDSTTLVTVTTGKVKVVREGLQNEVFLVAGESGVAKEGGVSRVAVKANSYLDWRQKNNAHYEREKKYPVSYIGNKYSWKKNQVNRSVIEGKLTSTASLAAYHRIVLKATYTKRNKKTASVRIEVEGVLRPGQSLTYRKKLLDILTQTQAVKVEVEKVETLP